MGQPRPAQEVAASAITAAGGGMPAKNSRRVGTRCPTWPPPNGSRCLLCQTLLSQFIPSGTIRHAASPHDIQAALPSITYGDRAALHVPVSHYAASVGSPAKPGHPRMVGSEVAQPVGCARITAKRNGLAAASAEVELRTGLRQLAQAPFSHPGRGQALKAGRFAQISASELSRTFQNSSPVIDSGHGRAAPCLRASR